MIWLWAYVFYRLGRGRYPGRRDDYVHPPFDIIFAGLVMGSIFAVLAWLFIATGALYVGIPLAFCTFLVLVSTVGRLMEFHDGQQSKS